MESDVVVDSGLQAHTANCAGDTADGTGDGGGGGGGRRATLWREDRPRTASMGRKVKSQHIENSIDIRCPKCVSKLAFCICNDTLTRRRQAPSGNLATATSSKTAGGKQQQQQQQQQSDRKGRSTVPVAREGNYATALTARGRWHPEMPEYENVAAMGASRPEITVVGQAQAPYATLNPSHGMYGATGGGCLYDTVTCVSVSDRGPNDSPNYAAAVEVAAWQTDDGYEIAADLGAFQDADGPEYENLGDSRAFLDNAPARAGSHPVVLRHPGLYANDSES